jgi:hypothetical protein
MSPLFPNVQSTLDLNGPELSFTTQPQSTSIASAATYSGVTTQLIQETYNGYPVRGYLYYPTSSGVSSNLDVVVLYHGTITDTGISPFDAASTFMQIAQNRVALKDKLIFSVAYPQDAIPLYVNNPQVAEQQFPGFANNINYLGDNIVYAEAALLWVQNRLSYYLASNNIPKTVNKVYTFGHSQGAYLTHRLNTLHSARYEIAFDMIGDGERQATAVRSFSLTISGKDISDETVNVTDTKGDVTTTNVGQGLTLSVTRYIDPNLSGSSGNPIGSIKYLVDISGISKPSLQVSVLDPTLRGSGLVDSNGSIALSPGYPNLISANVVPPAETTTVTDFQGTITATSLNNIGVTVTREIDDNLVTSTSPDGNPIGTVTYIVEITGASNPHLRTTVLDNTARAGGGTAFDGSIAVAGGYPIKLSANKFVLSFDMTSNVDSSQRQSTGVRSFSLTITSDGGAPVGGVVSNAPGPIDLLSRCSGSENTGNKSCDNIRVGFGATASNPDVYNARSLKNFLSGTLFPSLFTQAEDDDTGDAFGSPQVLNMQNVVQPGLTTCTNCATSTFKYYNSGGTGNTGGGHDAFANNPLVQKDIRDFVGSVSGGGVATFIGIATATFPPGQTERETNTGTVTHQWYSGTTALNDGSIGNVTITGAATTTLTLEGLTNPLPISGQVFLRAGYDPSAYFVAGIGKSTPNASNEPLDSNTAILTILPTISIDTQPQDTTVVEDNETTFSIVASVSDGSASDLRYQWYLNGSAISGATSATLSITRPNPGFDKVYCEVSHPTAQPGTIRSNVAKLDVATSRTFIKWEKIGLGTVQERGERDLATFGAFSARARTNINARIVQMWSPEKDIEVKVTLGGCAGGTQFAFPGGQGGISVFKMKMKQNTEYTVKLGVTPYQGGGPRGGNHGGGGLAVIYEKSRVLAVCGGGGGGGTTGRGGDGGGCNVAGESGVNGARGGALIRVDQLPVIGMTQAGRSGFNDFDNDRPGSGRLGGCTVGSDYWRQNGYAPCDDIPSTEPFRSVSGSVMSNTTGITRGYKTGQGWRNNGGAGAGRGGGGGAGARGGEGTFDVGGGGGASGYYSSQVELLSSSTLPNGTRLGGNNDVAFISVEAYNPGLDGQQEPFIPPRQDSNNDLRETTFNITRDSPTNNVIVYEKQSGLGPDTLTFGPNGGSFTAQIAAGAVYTVKSQPAGSKLRIDTHTNTLEVEDSTDDDYNDLKVNPNIGVFDSSTLSYTN